MWRAKLGPGPDPPAVPYSSLFAPYTSVLCVIGAKLRSAAFL